MRHPCFDSGLLVWTYSKSHECICGENTLHGTIEFLGGHGTLFPNHIVRTVVGCSDHKACNLPGQIWLVPPSKVLLNIHWLKQQRKQLLPAQKVELF
mmetsp:Transcript_135189/g.252726  ORF Transcript_135189/g.252726 Transcript_135189/m.252726 type:complete len:97 (+) Transcript_135189:364-654(+)